MNDNTAFINWFRNAVPYINAFRGKTFVICLSGEAVADSQFANQIHDFALLNSLGIKLVIAYGARHQIGKCLKERKIQERYANDIRITDTATLQCVIEANCIVRTEIESKLSMGLANSPMAGARIRVMSGNFVTAQPVGIKDGIDYEHTGKVRRIDYSSINNLLENENIVILSSTGYSSTGELFNLSIFEVAMQAAVSLKADKLVLLDEGSGLLDKANTLFREITLSDAQNILHNPLSDYYRDILQKSIYACQHGVTRAHIIKRSIPGAIIQELFTRDGIGTLITSEDFEGLRPATIDDVVGILELLSPLETSGNLVRRSRELIELEIDRFYIIERDGMIIACTALYPYMTENIAEFACLAVHPDYWGKGRGNQLYEFIVRKAKTLGIRKLFVLSTQTTHWFIERGFVLSDLDSLPVQKRNTYNYQRKSKLYIKDLLA